MSRPLDTVVGSLRWLSGAMANILHALEHPSLASAGSWSPSHFSIRYPAIPCFMQEAVGSITFSLPSNRG